MEGITIFFPAHNEEANVKQAIDSILTIAPTLTDDYEVIVVNDGSTDRTEQFARAYVENNGHVRLINHPTNFGYGAALQSGFRNATKDFVFYTDGDLQFDINELPDFWKMRHEADMICGYRVDRKDPFVRIVYAGIYNLLLRVLFDLRMKDVDCAFKLYKRKIFDNIKMEAKGALIDAEVVIRALDQGFSMKERGVHHFPRVAGEQSGGNFKVIMRAGKELVAFLVSMGLRQIVKRAVINLITMPLSNRRGRAARLGTVSPSEPVSRD